jgi:hypothetical protein
MLTVVERVSMYLFCLARTIYAIIIKETCKLI